MAARIALALAYAAFLGIWSYADLSSVEIPVLDNIRGIAAEFGIAFLLPILVGVAVRRWWVLLALLGPLLTLGYAQMEGERGFDGAEPLTSPVGISGFIWSGLSLAIGVGLGRAWETRRGGGDTPSPTRDSPR
jgi:hypothetical protein